MRNNSFRNDFCEDMRREEDSLVSHGQTLCTDHNTTGLWPCKSLCRWSPWVPVSRDVVDIVLDLSTTEDSQVAQNSPLTAFLDLALPDVMPSPRKSQSQAIKALTSTVKYKKYSNTSDPLIGQKVLNPTTRLSSSTAGAIKCLKF